MNWQSISFDWNQVRAFLATADEGSLSAAAKALGQTQPTIGRQINGLEQTLGVTLFERTGRRLILTQTGAELAEHVRDMALAANRVSMIAAGQSQDVSGKVQVTATDVFALYLLPPVIERLRRIAPGIVVDIVATNNLSDLLQREADIAIRHVRPEQPDLTARLVHNAKANLYAATSYLDRRGRPNSLADLSAHDFVSFGDPAEMITHLAPMGIQVTPDNFKAGSANGLVAWELVRTGVGVGIMSADVARNVSEVEILVSKEPLVEFPVWLVTHRELHTSKRIRLVFDTLAEMLPTLMA